MSGIDLYDKIILRKAKLINVNLNNSTLWKADLSEADLTGTNIEAALNLASHHALLVDESKNKNTELLTELRNLTRGFRHSYNSEGSSYYDIFLWDTASRGDFTLEKFLEATGFLAEVDSIDLLEGKFHIEEFNFILKDIKEYISNREYFYLKIGRLCDYEPIPLLIGNTQVGDWIGISPVLDIERGGEEEIAAIVQFPAPTSQFTTI